MKQKKEMGRIVIRSTAAILLAAVLFSFSGPSEAAAGPSEDIKIQQAQRGPAAEQEELQGVWISYLDWNRWPKEEAGFRKAAGEALDLCAESGLNAVFVHVRPDGDAMYPSRYFPWSKFASGTQGKDPGYDPLAFLVEEAHRRGLQFHAWVNPFRVTGYLNRYEDLSPDNPAVRFERDDDPRNDRWVLKHRNELYYNPAVPEVRRLICQGVREIAACYPVDGIHFDDYFYPVLNDGDEALQFDYPEYLASGSNLPAAEWRRENINALVRDVYRAVKEERPGALFGISPQGYLKHLRMDDRLFTDIDAWMTEPGYIDYVMPQIYWGFEAKQNGEKAPYAFDSCLEEWVQLAGKGNVTLYTGLPLYKAGTDASDGNEVPEWKRRDDVISRQIQTGRSSGRVKGFCLYDFSSLTREAAAAEVKSVKELIR